MVEIGFKEWEEVKLLDIRPGDAFFDAVSISCSSFFCSGSSSLSKPVSILGTTSQAHIFIR